MEVPVGHGERRDGLEDADEAVGLEDQLPVHEAVFLGVAGWAEEDVGFWRFKGKDCRCSAVGKTAESLLET